jgi:hypothetical protein
MAVEMLAAVDDELRQVDALRQDLHVPTFAVSGMMGSVTLSGSAQQS